MTYNFSNYRENIKIFLDDFVFVCLIKKLSLPALAMISKTRFQFDEKKKQKQRITKCMYFVK